MSCQCDIRNITTIWDTIRRGDVETLVHEILQDGSSWTTEKLQNSIVNAQIVQVSNSNYELKHSVAVTNSELPNAVFISIEISRP